MRVSARPKPPFRPISPGASSNAKRPSGSKGGQGLDSQLQTLIGEQLRLFYADLLNEPVPERFVALVDRLDPPEGPLS